MSRIEEIHIEEGALHRAAPYCLKRGLMNALLVTDEHTLEAAGRRLEDSLHANSIRTQVCMLTPNRAGDVVADEASIVQTMLHIGEKTEALIAVGGCADPGSRAQADVPGDPA